ncbi:MAG: hypothetical protein HUU13_05020 [Burkholderiaceae bacterium]|nr:hypothetical protein [Burkholderiaceae bacterium]
MTIDFRNPDQALRGADAAVPALAPHQRFILLVLGLCGAGLCMAGLWLLLRPVPWLAPEVAPLLGLAFLLSSVGDVVAAFFLRWIWRRAANRYS